MKFQFINVFIKSALTRWTFLTSVKFCIGKVFQLRYASSIYESINDSFVHDFLNNQFAHDFKKCDLWYPPHFTRVKLCVFHDYSCGCYRTREITCRNICGKLMNESFMIELFHVSCWLKRIYDSMLLHSWRNVFACDCQGTRLNNSNICDYDIESYVQCIVF